jgi:DNA-binding response OmpR family regulator
MAHLHITPVVNASPPTPGRILYAEDDETSRLSICELLRREGYDCVAAPDGVVAAELLGTERFDCLISDIKMLGNANLELIRAVPQLQPGLPVILVTGFPSVETAVESMNLPVMAYLTKPVEFPALLAAVREAVFRRQLLDQSEATCAHLRQWLADAGQLAEGLRRSPRTPTDGPAEIYLTLTYRNVVEALLGLKTVMEQSLPNRAPEAPSGSPGTPPLILIDALRDAIAVLEKTKDAFRSRELGDLRRRLEDLLQMGRK